MTMLKSRLCEYSDTYIHLTGNVTIIGTATATQGDNPAETAGNNGNNNAFIFKFFQQIVQQKKVIHTDNASDFHVSYNNASNLLKYCDNYFKACVSLNKSAGDEKKLFQQIYIIPNKKNNSSTPEDNNIKEFTIDVMLKYLSNCWEILEIDLIFCGLTLLIT